MDDPDPTVEPELPIKTMKGRDCSYTVDNGVLSGKAVCDFDLSFDKFSWIDEQTAHLTSDATEPADELIPANSELYMKRTKAFCREYLALNQNLLAGRNCNSSAQCVTMNCQEGKCVGGDDAATCHEH